MVRMDDLRFYVLFNSTSVISGCWVGDNERLCAMEPSLQLKRSPPSMGKVSKKAGNTHISQDGGKYWHL